mmetsp:Transcript_71973/g.155472  ORF Transcript_71973/g.155472 Transcript_71973/m.155472 type:complete len:306 (-) Transcript_71973:78-995(-)
MWGKGRRDSLDAQAARAQCRRHRHCKQAVDRATAASTAGLREHSIRDSRGGVRSGGSHSTGSGRGGSGRGGRGAGAAVAELLPRLVRETTLQLPSQRDLGQGLGQGLLVEDHFAGDAPVRCPRRAAAVRVALVDPQKLLRLHRLRLRDQGPARVLRLQRGEVGVELTIVSLFDLMEEVDVLSRVGDRDVDRPRLGGVRLVLAGPGLPSREGDQREVHERVGDVDVVGVDIPLDIVVPQHRGRPVGVEGLRHDDGVRLHTRNVSGLVAVHQVRVLDGARRGPGDRHAGCERHHSEEDGGARHAGRR